MSSRAQALLHLAGVSGADLARDLGLTRAAVSLQLNGGTASTSTELLEAIAARAGKAVADAVGLAIAGERAARAEATP